MKAMLLLSGGIDSLALAAWLRPSHALTVDYGQKAAGKEKEVASYVSHQLGMEHMIVTADWVPWRVHSRWLARQVQSGGRFATSSSSHWPRWRPCEPGCIRYSSGQSWEITSTPMVV
jgi:7-cyano-7-deazaguanine synthase in queuosine biosynthesis